MGEKTVLVLAGFHKNGLTMGLALALALASVIRCCRAIFVFGNVKWISYMLATGGWQSERMNMGDVKDVRDPRHFSLLDRVKSFSYALQGIGFMLKTQHNAWLHAVATLGVIALAVYCDVSAADWRWLVVAMAMVWVGETVNTAVEYVCDVVSPNFHQAVKHAKDIAAGGVLIAAVAAAVIGVLTFWPYFF